MGYSLDSTNLDCYEGTSVLINKLNIRDEVQLMENEALITGIKSAVLLCEDMLEGFDFGNYKDIHKILFEDLYSWAGEIRSVSLSKSSTKFVDPDKIETLGFEIFNRLKKENYFKEMNRDDFVKEIADLYNNINILHPFREGNGRTQRIFFIQLIRQAGYDIDFSELNSEFMMISTIQAANGIMDNLIKFFDENII